MVVTLLAFFSLQANRSLAWAIRIGMVILLAAQVFGLLIIANGSSTFGPAGAMKYPCACLACPSSLADPGLVATLYRLQ